jgi:hypothetical protein
LTLPIQIFSICTNARVVQRCVHRDAVRRAALFRGRCGKAGAVERQAPYSGQRRGKKISHARPKLRRATSFFCGVGPRGVEPPRTPALVVCLWTRYLWQAGCRYRRRAVITLPLRLFLGRGCGASATTPGYSAQAHHAVSELMPPFFLVCGAGRKSNCAMRRELRI